MKITEAELLEALREASKVPEEAKSARELAEEHGVPVPTIVRALNVLFRQGRIQHHNVRRLAMDGKMRPVPVYTVLPKPKGKRG